MKKLVLMLVAMAAVVLTGCGKKVGLVIYLPTEYLDNGLVKDFEKKYDIDVKIQTFESNEEAHRMIVNESFDLVIPSDYMIEQLAAEDELYELDYTKLSNFSEDKMVSDLRNSLQTLKNAEGGFDFLKYSVPYFFGNLGLLYDTRDVELNVLEEKNWAILADTNYEIGFYNSARDAYFIAFTELGISQNTKDAAEIKAATDYLANVISKGKKAGKLSVVTDEILDYMLYPDDTKYDVAIAYSGDAAWLMSENEHLGFYLPSNGTNMFVDGMVIPKNAKHVEMAYNFINFMWEEKSLVDNSICVGYTTPSQAAYDVLTGAEGDYKDISAYYVRYTQYDAMFRYNPLAYTKITEGWLEASVQ